MRLDWVSVSEDGFSSKRSLQVQVSLFMLTTVITFSVIPKSKLNSKKRIKNVKMRTDTYFDAGLLF